MERIDRGGRKAAEARLSLSAEHISPGGVLEWSDGGDYVRVKSKGNLERSEKKRGIRGVPRGFSHASRLRLLQFVASLPRERLCTPILCTLTYHNEWGSSWEDWKRDLDTFLKAVYRKYGPIATLWRQDLQKRGAPHFHLLFFREADMDWLWMRDLWGRTVYRDLLGPFHLRVRLERVRTWNGVMSYAAHYIGKVTNESLRASPMGRQWGVRYAKLFGVRMNELLLTHEEFEEVRWGLIQLKADHGRDSRIPVGIEGLFTFLPAAEVEALIRACVGELSMLDS